MAANVPKLSAKHLMIDKANQSMVVVLAVASFVVMFCLVASYTLLGQLAYQNKVIQIKKTALTQLKSDISNTQNLVTSYKAFVTTPQNIIGGSSTGQGPKDGDNARIVLDALPSKYDYPALATSLEKLTLDNGLTIQSITGTDDEAAQTNTDSSTPAPVPMPFQLSVSGSYTNVKAFMSALQASIRPFQIQTLELSGNDANLTLTVTGQTFYQPSKNLNIKMEPVK